MLKAKDARQLTNIRHTMLGVRRRLEAEIIAATLESQCGIKFKVNFQTWTNPMFELLIKELIDAGYIVCEPYSGWDGDMIYEIYWE